MHLNAQTREQLRQILAVLYRYVHTTASVMVKNPPKATDLLNEYQSVLEMGSTWFPWTVGKLTGSQDLGRQFPSYSEPLKTGQWNTVLLIIQDDMKKALTREPC
ncbi:MAG: hypothetical protein HC898_05155 [Phycisphaerales bacterium]|nr:hypothetical protein [Phycisphaerales bacterium]